MLVDLDKIIVEGRIRKDFGNIEELAEDIAENGLINPPVVAPDFRLIAGERRLRACRHLGWRQVEVRVMTVRDYEHQLKMEISENENRKEFTFSERVEWARRLEEVERLKARERMEAGVEIDPTENFPQGETRDIVASQSGFGSGKQYEKAKYIADHATPETIHKLDEGEISIHRAYEQTKRELADREAELAEARDTERALRDTIESLRSQPKPAPEVEKPVYQVREVVPTDIQSRLDEMERRLEEAESERDEAEASLAKTLVRIQELERIERSVNATKDSPLYNLYRSLAGANGYLSALSTNVSESSILIAEANQDIIDKLKIELTLMSRHVGNVAEMIRTSRTLVVDTQEQKSIIEVIA